MKNIIEIKNLCVNYKISSTEKIHAVRNLNLIIQKGETVAVVGESGCGKSTLALSLINLLPDNAEVFGSIRIDGEEILNKNHIELEKIRGRKVGMIFQDPGASLNPVFSIKEQIEETLRICNKIKDKNVLKNTVIKLLKEAGIKDAERVYESYPHQLSGGLQQRVMIAIALSLSPEILIADEPTTSLDVTVQAQIIELLKILKRERNLTTLLITHDLHLAMELCKRIVVMYAGEVVEDGYINSIKDARHPYTRTLFEIIPDIKRKTKKFKIIKGEIPDLKEDIKYCSFADRCEYVKEKCRKEHPEYKKIRKNSVKCFYPLKWVK